LANLSVDTSVRPGAQARKVIRPQLMVFTLSADYVQHHGGVINSRALVRIGNELGLSEAAVRSAVARMARTGWLTAGKGPTRATYALTPQMRTLVRDLTRRIVTRRDGPWSGDWTILSYVLKNTPREVRDRFRQRLTWLGFGQLMPGTCIAPHDLQSELDELIRDLNVSGSVEFFYGQHLGLTETSELVRRCWNVGGINRYYDYFVERHEPLFEADSRRFAQGSPPPDNECFVHRFFLIHEYLRFFCLDPDLPSQLIPPNWAGGHAAELFGAYHQLLAEPATRFFLDACDAQSG
jgi:phenylacetic acid degradation operon negative regulatory protein